jgi:predicted permease
MDLLDIVLPIFLVIGLGYGLRRLRMIREDTNAALTRLVFYVASPALLFRSVARTPLAESLNPVVLLTAAGVALLVAAGAYALAGRTTPERRGVLAQGAHRSNLVFAGLPLVLSAFGEEALGRASVYIAFMTVHYNFLAVITLTLPHRASQGSRLGALAGTSTKVLKNPLIIACVAGILFRLLGGHIPGSLDRALELVGRTAPPLGLLSVGAGLDFGKVRAELPAIGFAALIKLVIYPGLGYIALRAIGMSGLDLGVPILMMACPTAVVSFVMAREMKGNAQLAAAIVIGTTVASLLTIIGYLALLRHL